MSKHLKVLSSWAQVVHRMHKLLSRGRKAVSTLLCMLADSLRPGQVLAYSGHIVLNPKPFSFTPREGNSNGPDLDTSGSDPVSGKRGGEAHPQEESCGTSCFTATA